MSETKIAVLSNVNLNFTIRKLQREVSVYQPEGFGNELGLMMDPTSGYSVFQPQYTFLILDLSELVRHERSDRAKELLEGWFSQLEACLQDRGIYYVSDGYFWNPEKLAFPCDLAAKKIENLYDTMLSELLERHQNLRIFPLAARIREMGEQSTYSAKTWYLGKILYSNEFQGVLAQGILDFTRVEQRSPKKVLVIDLDNTIWGGLAGDYPETDLELSEDHSGLAFKNSQRFILDMKRAGVLLAIASKNNPEDAWNVIDNHPHMVLKREDFAAVRINWQSKDQNLRELSEELNLGLDSFVFWDDQGPERALIKEMIPEVTVPDFPGRPEELTDALKKIYDSFFRKGRLTGEDLTKTDSYVLNGKRRDMLARSGDFGEYLKKLDIGITPCDPKSHAERFLQLLNKTNQFNLTTRRYSAEDLQKLLSDEMVHCFLFRVEDCFGDYGITAAVIVDCHDTPVITDWVLSCRIMGKKIENAILDHIEQEMARRGYREMRGIFIPTPKNLPVAELYDRMGYTVLQEEPTRRVYHISLATKGSREYYVHWKI